ncbi:MAG: Rieske (2Fe-2S) protein, partial [Asticcacaulis sp.]|nr:Rieske (2Fe-2S) protein [Asticcacaulis sp.]
MSLPAGIKTTWLPVALSRQVQAKPLKRRIAGEAIVLWRSKDGIRALRDRCPHRNYPLSAGSVENGALTCPYHGWRFDGDGRCIEIPGCTLDANSKLKAETIAVAELDGAVFVRLEGGRDDGWIDALPPMPDTPDVDHFWWAMRPETARVFDALDNVL